MTRKQNTSQAGRRIEALTALLTDVPKADDHDGVRDYLHGLAALGCAPLLVLPGTKQPADMRTPQRRTADDRAARQAARDASRRNWQRVKSGAGVHLASTDAAVLESYVDRYRKSFGDAVEVNVAVALGRSRLVVVDCDTAGQLAAFLADAGAKADTAPTVTTPGSVDRVTGEWLHSGGGHFWFAVPDGTQLPDSPGALTDPSGGYAIMWGSGRYVLTPPSTRPEGAYVATGAAVYPLPGWLCDRITEHARLRTERAQRSHDHAADASPITAWGANTTWAEILAGTHWIATGKADNCGCETWTAPGAHASSKSATAHEPGCGQWDSPDPPLHVWTDHDIEPFDAVVGETGSPTITRLRALAAISYDNKIEAAMTALDLDEDLGFGDADGDDNGHVDTDTAGFERDISKRLGQLLVDREARKRLAATEVAEIKLPPIISLNTLLALPDDPVRMRIESVWPAGGCRTLNAAPAGAGKTTLNCNLIRSLADGDPFLDAFEVHQRAEHIVVIDLEMNQQMLKRWLRHQGVRNAAAVVDVVTLRGQAGLFDLGNDKLRDMWSRRLRDLGCDFVIFDCLSPVIHAMGLKEATELGKFLYPMNEMLKEAGVADVLVHHHMGHVEERARGDSTALGWSDANWKQVIDGDHPMKPRYFSTSKVRDADEPVGEGLLSFDKATGRLTYAGGTRAETGKSEAVEKRLHEVLEVLADRHAEGIKDEKGMGTTAIKTAVKGDKTITDKALTLAYERKLVTLHREGTRQAVSDQARRDGPVVRGLRRGRRGHQHASAVRFGTYRLMSQKLPLTWTFYQPVRNRLIDQPPRSRLIPAEGTE